MVIKKAEAMRSFVRHCLARWFARKQAAAIPRARLACEAVEGEGDLKKPAVLAAVEHAIAGYCASKCKWSTAVIVTFLLIPAFRFVVLR